MLQFMFCFISFNLVSTSENSKKFSNSSIYNKVFSNSKTEVTILVYVLEIDREMKKYVVDEN